MIIGVPKEIKTHENRVAVQPAGVQQLVKNGHDVIIQEGAGRGSGFEDKAYLDAGARLERDASKIWAEAEMIMKVKEPIEPEYSQMREGQIVFTYFHFAASRPLTEAVIQSRCVAIAYETVEAKDGSLPLLIPMSEVAGRMSAQEGAKYLEKPMGGRGILMGGIPGVAPAEVMVLGGGVVGVNAAKIAAGMGAHVTILDINLAKLRYLDDVMPPNVSMLFSNETNIRYRLPRTDLVIGGVLKPGAKAPHLVTKDMLSLMRPGSVLVDVAIDQGGCFETSVPTTHDKPVYHVDDILHYCVANMPGAVPYTSTLGLTNATLPYALQIANHGWKNAAKNSAELLKGVNIVNGVVVYEGVAKAFDLEYRSAASML